MLYIGFQAKLGNRFAKILAFFTKFRVNLFREKKFSQMSASFSLPFVKVLLAGNPRLVRYNLLALATPPRKLYCIIVCAQAALGNTGLPTKIEILNTILRNLYFPFCFIHDFLRL